VATIATVSPVAFAEGSEPAVHFVIDVSGSMAGDKLNSAVSAVKSTAAALPDTTALGLRSYAGSCDQSGVDPLVPLDTNNDAEISAAADTLVAGGGTPTTAALSEGINDLKAFPTSGNRRLVLLTDGDTQCGISICDFIRGTDLSGINLSMYAVGLQVSSGAAADLKCAAELTGGSYIEASDPSQLVAALLSASGGPNVSGYVAMGDSFSSGEGNPPFEDGTAVIGTDTCHRSSKAYPALLAAQKALDLKPWDSVACSGALRRHLWLPNKGNSEPAQLDALTTRNPKLVTLSIGGNDVEFPAMIKKCITGPGLEGNSNCQQQAAKDPDTGAKTTLDGRKKALVDALGRDSDNLCETPNGWVTCAPSLHALYEYIAADAPGAHVRVLLYPHLFNTNPKESGCRFPVVSRAEPAVYIISKANILWINAGVDLLNQKIISEVKKAQAEGVTDIEYVDPRPRFDDDANGDSRGGHGVCTANPWINGPLIQPDLSNPVSPYSFHPNADGHKNFADAMISNLAKPAA
jgi:lysophospholipase L1-like esterase